MLNSWQEKIKAVSTLTELDEIRSLYLGKTGLLTQEMKGLGALSADERKEKGQVLNILRESIDTALKGRRDYFEEIELQTKINAEAIDVTLPIRPEKVGNLHILSQVMEEIECYFARFGFKTEQGPDIDTEDHNFNALNIPSHHPARQSQDTFYLDSKDPANRYLLRTHTSNIQIHTIRNQKPPLRKLALGRAYRSDAIDATHTPMFHQVEIFAVDKKITMGHLKSTLIDFLRAFFDQKDLEIRFRPSFFPFTEPSAEIDIRWKDKGWLEVGGCGLIHPNVLTNCNLDPKEYQGFAAGMGIERLAMLKYGITDIRTFFENDQRFLEM